MPKADIKKEVKRRIGPAQSMLMMGVAVAFDSVQIFLLMFFGVGLIVNRFVTLFAFMTFFLWFALNGVSFFSGKMSTKKLFSFFGSSFGEVIPIVGSLPLWSIGIWYTLKSVKKEDESV